MAEPWEVEGSIEDAIKCLEDASKDLADISAECEDNWPAITETLGKVEAALAEARKILPLHPEIQAEIDRHDDEADRYADWLANGNNPRL